MSRRRWLPPALWAAVIVVGTSVPGPDLPQGPEGSDKVLHLLAYGVLGGLVLRAAMVEWPRARRVATMVASLGAIAAFAALDELHQRLVPGRSADPRDWLADVVGAAVAILLTAAALERREPTT